MKIEVTISKREKKDILTRLKNNLLDDFTKHYYFIIQEAVRKELVTAMRELELNKKEGK